MLHAVKLGWLPPLNEMNKIETYEPIHKTAKKLWEVWEEVGSDLILPILLQLDWC